MTRRRAVPPRPHRGNRTPSMTANLEFIDGPVVVGVAGDYIRWPEPVQPEQKQQAAA